MIIFIFINVILLGAMVFNIYLLIRNQQVFKFRQNLLNNDYETYGKLPSYNDMMKKFWILDLYMFIPEDKEKVNEG